MDQKMNVYVWDMDETLILLKSLINGTYAEAFNGLEAVKKGVEINGLKDVKKGVEINGLKDVEKGVEIGKTWENHILQVCDESFFYEQIENCNMPFLDFLSQYDDGQDLSDYNFTEDEFGSSLDDINKRKLAYRHRLVAQKYKKGLRSILDENMIKSWENLYEETDSFTDKWLSSARACLEQCSVGNKETSSVGRVSDCTNTRIQHVNLLVTSGSLIPSLVKCLLFRLDDLIPYENVYSSWEVGKLQCFSWIKERFSSQNVQFCVIGDGWEECGAAQTLKWPFVQVDPRPGSPHRFPGLTVRTLSHYVSVVYENANEEAEEKSKSQLQLQ